MRLARRIIGTFSDPITSRLNATHFRLRLRISTTLPALILAAFAAPGCGSSTDAPEQPANGSQRASQQPGDEAKATTPRPELADSSAERQVAHASPKNAAIDPPPATTLEQAAEARSTVAVEDWTSFRNGPQQLGIAHTKLPDKLELLWERDAPDGVISTPAIADGRVYVGILHGDLLCLDLQTGEPIWSYRSIESTDPKEFAPGFQTPVTVTEDLVLAGDEDGTLHAVDRMTGKLRWKMETDGEVVGGATIVGDSLIFGSHGGKLLRVKLADGAIVWEFETKGPVNASPTLAGKYTFVTGCDQPILRVVDIESGTQHAEVPLDGLLVATPAFRDNVLYFGTSDGIVFALDWEAKHTVWQYADPNRQFEIHSSPAVTDDLVIIGSRDKRLHALHRKTGEVAWTFATRAGIDCSPVVCGNRVYFGSSDKNVYGLTIADGKEVWKYPAGQSITGSPAIGEGRLVIGTETSNGRILCFGAK